MKHINEYYCIFLTLQDEKRLFKKVSINYVHIQYMGFEKITFLKT